MGMSSAQLAQQQITTLARMALVLVAFGALLLLLELSVVHCRDNSERMQCTLFRAVSGNNELDDLGLRTLEREHELPPPPAWLEPLPRSNVPAQELLHLSQLHASCLANPESVIPWTVGKPGVSQMNDRKNAALVLNRDDPRLLEQLRQCPDVDLYLPECIRGHGYCEDGAAYAKFLETRMLPRWVLGISLFDPQLNRTVTYHELCPRTPMLFFNHYWDGVPTAPTFPKSKPVYMMPNIEMYELNATHLARVDVVLCKTVTCYDRVTQWYKQEGNPRNAKIFYTRHTTSDVAGFARKKLGTASIKPKDYANVRFIHTAGSSGWKGTRQVLDCWLARPDLPQLDVFVTEGAYERRLEPKFGARIAASASKNVNVTVGSINPLAFGKIVAEASFFLCPSVMEGYGHYLNQARASGGVIVTTDIAPMNELIPSTRVGMLVETEKHRNPRQFLSGAHPTGLRDVAGMSARFSGGDVCHTVSYMLRNTDEDNREAMAMHARALYHADTKFFVRQMRTLRRFAKKQSAKPSMWRSVIRRQPIGD